MRKSTLFLSRCRLSTGRLLSAIKTSMKLRWLIFGARETTHPRNLQAESWVCGNELTQVINLLPRQDGYGINSSAKTRLVPYLPAKHGIRRFSPVFAGLQNFPFSIKSNLPKTPFAYRFS